MRVSRSGALAPLLAAVIGLVAAGLVLEIGVRLLIPVSDFFWEPDRVMGVQLVPGKSGRWVKPGLFDVRVTINTHGLRDREHTWDKPAGVKRVVLLGDSYVEALQVPLEQSVSVRLERALRAEGMNAETLNLGVSGFGTGREYLMLRERGLRYAPDVVLLFFVGNDLLNNSRRLEGLPYVPYPMLNGHDTLARDAANLPRFTPIADQPSSSSPLLNGLKDHSQAYRFVRATVEGSPAVHATLYRLGVMGAPPQVDATETSHLGLYEIYRIPPRPELAESWTLTERLLIETRNLAQSRGARFAVVLVPSPWEVYPDRWQDIVARTPAMQKATLDLDEPSRKLRQFLTAESIAYLDLGPEFRARQSASPTLYFNPDHHWTAEGHRLAAETIAPRLAAMVKQP